MSTLPHPSKVEYKQLPLQRCSDKLSDNKCFKRSEDIPDITLIPCEIATSKLVKEDFDILSIEFLLENLHGYHQGYKNEIVHRSLA